MVTIMTENFQEITFIKNHKLNRFMEQSPILGSYISNSNKTFITAMWKNAFQNKYSIFTIVFIMFIILPDPKTTRCPNASSFLYTLSIYLTIHLIFCIL